MAGLICVECSLNFIGTLTLLSRVWVPFVIPTPGMRDSGTHQSCGQSLNPDFCSLNGWLALPVCYMARPWPASLLWNCDALHGLAIADEDS